jgi:predicted chitinase
VRLLDFNSWSSLNEAVAFDPAAKYPDQTFGFTIGTVDSGKAVTGGNGGNWGGSMPRALWFASLANDFMSKTYKKSNTVSSQKRSKKLTASGNTSDHYEGNQDAYAVDLACAGAEGDALLAHLMQAFGHPEYKGGSWFSVVKGGYRYQVGWKVKNHYDHIHVGVKKSDSSDTTTTATSTTPVSSATTAIAGNTFAEKLFNNPMFKQWSVTMMPGGASGIQLKDVEYALARPGAKSWFMHSFNLDSEGNLMDTQGNKVELQSDAATTTTAAASTTASTTTAVDPSLATKNIKSNYSGEKAKNIDLLIDEMKAQGITNKYAQIGILSTIGKESGFVPQNEIGYSKTSNDRIRKIFGKRVKGLTDEQLNSIKADDSKFFDQVYGPPAKAFLGFNTGNDAVGDGYKYRGRGFNGITFKTGYEKYSKETGMDLVSNPDLLNDITVAAKAAIAFFKNNLKTMGHDVSDPNVFTSKDAAITAAVKANHGGVMPGGVDALAKAKEVSANLDLV